MAKDALILNHRLKQYWGSAGDVVLSDEVQVVCSEAFKGVGITSLTIPASVTLVETRAFEDCKSLTTLVIKSPDTILQYGAFKGCSALCQLGLPERYPYACFLAVSNRLAYLDFDQLKPEYLTSQTANWIAAGMPSYAPCEAILIYLKKRCYDVLVELVDGAEVKGMDLLLRREILGRLDVGAVDDLIKRSRNAAMTALLLDYKNKIYTKEEIEAYERDKVAKAMGEKDYSLSDYERIFTVEEKGDGYLLSDYRGTEETLVVSGSLDGKPVVGIADATFKHCKTLKHIVLPDSVRSIGRGAFFFCENLQSITFGNGLKSLVDGIFCGCTFTSVVLPDSVETAGGNTGLGVFFLCSDLRSVTLGRGVRHLGRLMGGNGSLKELRYKGDLSSWCNVDVQLCALADAERFYIKGKVVKDLVIPDGVEEILQCVFSGCSRLRSVTIPKSTKRIGGFAFGFCRNLTEVRYLGTLKEWARVKKKKQWCGESGATCVLCLDGEEPI